MRTAAILVSLIGASVVPTTAQAGWIEMGSTPVEFGATEPSLDFVAYLPGQASLPGTPLTLRTRIAHVDEGGGLRLATRDILETENAWEGTWDVETAADAYSGAGAWGVVDRPKLAMDKEGRAFIAYVDNAGSGSNAYKGINVAYEVGAGQGNCGDGFGWRCVTVKVGDTVHGPPQIVLQHEDNVLVPNVEYIHLVYALDNEIWHSRIRRADLATCTTQACWDSVRIGGTLDRYGEEHFDDPDPHGKYPSAVGRYGGETSGNAYTRKPVISWHPQGAPLSVRRFWGRSIWFGESEEVRNWSESLEIGGKLVSTIELIHPDGAAGLGRAAVASADTCYFPSTMISYREEVDDGYWQWSEDWFPVVSACNVAMAFNDDLQPHIVYESPYDAQIYLAVRGTGRQGWETEALGEYVYDPDIIHDPFTETMTIALEDGHSGELVVLDGFHI